MEGGGDVLAFDDQLFDALQATPDDEVADDVEDARIRALALADEASDSFEEIRFSDTGVDAVSE